MAFVRYLCIGERISRLPGLGVRSFFVLYVYICSIYVCVAYAYDTPFMYIALFENLYVLCTLCCLWSV